MALRHNWLRDTIAKLLSSAKCKDVKIEPQLLPTNGKSLSSGSITADQARLDISARSVWNVCERAFFDVRVFNPLAPSNSNKLIIIVKYGCLLRTVPKEILDSLCTTVLRYL